MQLIKLKDENELELTVSTIFPSCCVFIMGGNDDTPSWEEYMSNVLDDNKPHFILIKKAIEDLNWIGETGRSKANKICFMFSDGLAFKFSGRAWGDLMSAIVNKNEGYMTYYL
jgi:hypothetical protein